MTEGDGPDAEPLPKLVPGRGRLRDYALQRLKASRVLQASAVVAVLCYGALPFLVVFPDPRNARLHFWSAALVILMSLASWSLLFWWYPVFERTQKVLGNSDQGRIIARTLETLAIGCVMIVHGLMAFIIIRAGVTP
jgi:cytochrome c oxidase assembly factor CtaG